MLDSWVIEEIKRKERQWQPEQPQLPPPPPPPEPRRREPEKKPDRGVAIIEL